MHGDFMDKNDYMNIALEEAKNAYLAGEVPVGAIIVKNGEIISRGHNNREETGDATGHAETIAIREACNKLGTWRLEDCELYVTLEPCPMCMGAIINSRIKKVVYGAKDARAGACGSLVDLTSYPFNHKPIVECGVMNDECSSILTDFFFKKR